MDVGTLERPSDAAAMRGTVLRKDVLAIREEFRPRSLATHGFVHAVETKKRVPKQRGLAANTGGANDRGYLSGCYAHV